MYLLYFDLFSIIIYQTWTLYPDLDIVQDKDPDRDQHLEPEQDQDLYQDIDPDPDIDIEQHPDQHPDLDLELMYFLDFDLFSIE